MADEWGEGGDGKDIDKNENKGEKKMGSAGGNKENRDGAKVFQMKRVKRKQGPNGLCLLLCMQVKQWDS